MHVTGTSYRPDLDGVRAIAVVSVILYHFDFSWIAGGFAGVDIFFVLSGFFITSQIATQLERGDFSLANFYERRIRRIIPALLVMLFATTLAALVLLMPDELRRFCRSLIAATLSLSNIHFYRSSDYFAAPAQSEPLLHTWSLSVEEQFYLLFPIALMAAYRWLPRYCIHLTTAVLAVSFAFSVWAVSAQPMAAFFCRRVHGSCCSAASWP